MTYYNQYTHAINKALEGLVVTDHLGATINTELAFKLWREWTCNLAIQNKTCFLIGNGASATMASHMAVDGTKSAGIKALAFNDSAFLTAISNDLGCEDMFALPLKRFAQVGDLLTSISSSGNSPNVVRALECARDMKLSIITLSGMTPNNRSRSFGNLNFYIPAATYGIIESSHAVVLHCWLDYFMDNKDSK